MKQTSRRHKPQVEKRPSAGPDGIVLAPPAYGIESVDRAVMQTAPEAPIQRKAARPALRGGDALGKHSANQTGLPDTLKSGVESLSGFSMDDVRVHYNSSKPAGLNALAYTQGTDIHVAPGQERHLPHEAWHVVQQAQGRVQPTMQMQSGVQVNDDRGLEHEADIMGAKALRMDNNPQAVQLKAFHDIAKNNPQVKQAAQLQAGSGVIQRVQIARIDVTLSGKMPQWDQDGLTYHLNLTTDPPHITCENWPKDRGSGTTKMQFFFKRKDNGDIVNAVSGQRGKKKFSDLPSTVQNFVSNNYDAILAVDE